MSTLSLIHPETSYERYLEEWLEVKKTEVAASTLDRYKNRIRVHVVDVIGDFAIEEIDKDVLDDFINVLNKKNSDKLHTLRDVYLIVHNSLERAKEEGIIPENPATEIDVPSISGYADMVILDDNQYASYIEAVSKHQQFIAIYLVAEEGLQPGEALALTWSDVDFDSKVIHVSKTLSRDGKHLISKKDEEEMTNASIRKIKVREKTITLLKQVKDAQDKMGQINPIGLVLPTKNGTPILAKNMTRTHKTYTDRLNLPRTNFMDLRNMFILRSIRGGVNPLELTEHLGLSDMRYLKAFADKLTKKQKQAINKVSKKRYKRNIFTENV